ncbi:MAG: LCP family protein [Candidatus Limnocylindria bacterium]
MTDDLPNAAGDPSAPAPSGDGRPDAQTRGRYLPATLDALVPGLGHLVAGRRRRAMLFLAPFVVAAVIVLATVLTTSPARLVATLVDDGVLIGLLVVQGLLLVWRVAAVGSSLLAPGVGRPGRRDALPMLLLAAFVIAPQAFAGYATQVARETADEVFVEPTPVAVAPSFTPEPDPSFLSTPAPSPSLTASPSPTPAVPRITGLIVGVDAGAGRTTYATDTMIVVSLDPTSGTVSMLSIPRDMVDVPLPDGRVFSGKINGLVSYARHHPRQFPGTDGTGFDVLIGALGTLLELDISYYATVSLGGFVSVIDRLGGVDVHVTRAFCDPGYREYGYPRGFSITAGHHHLDGYQALAYARVRRASGESDFTRAARQQEVISGVRDAIERGGFLNDPIGLLKDLGRIVQTNVPRSALPDLAEAASEVSRAETYRAVVTHPLVRSGFDRRGSIQVPDVAAIRALSAALFPTGGPLPPATYQVPQGSSKPATSSGVGSCAPAPTPKPTAKPTPVVTPPPTATPDATATATPDATATPPPDATATPAPTPTPGPTASPSPTPTPAPTPTP